MPRQRRSQAASASSVVQAADTMVVQIEALVDEISELRADGDALRAELREAVTMLERASAALGDARLNLRSRRRQAPPTDGARPRRAPRRQRGVRGRATPSEVTADVVRAVLGKLGEATAAEIASEITKAGAPVSGRAVRFIAERAGAQTSVGPDGQRRYRIP